MRALLVGQGDGGDGARDVAGPLGRSAIEAGVGADVRKGQSLARREYEARDPLAGLHALANGPRALWAGGHPEFEAIRIGLEQGDGSCFCVEQADGRVDDRLQESLLTVGVESGRNRRPPRPRSNDGQCLIQRLAVSSSGWVAHRGIA